MVSILENVGQFIAEKRKIHKTLSTQEALAECVSITRPTLIKIESGETSSSFELIHKILVALDTNLKEFEDFVEEQSVENKISSFIKNSSDRDKLLKMVQELQ